MARQGLSPVQRDTVYANFYNPVLAPRSTEGSEWVNVFSGSCLPNHPTDPPQPDRRDLSQLLTTADCRLEEHSEEHAVFESEPTACAADSPTHSNYRSPGLEDMTFNEPQEAPPQTGNGGHDLVSLLAQELAEQLIKFQGCCHNCHQAANQSRVASPTVQRVPDILVNYTLFVRASFITLNPLSYLLTVNPKPSFLIIPLLPRSSAAIVRLL